MMLTILVFVPKQPGDRIDVYLRTLVDDLKILWRLSLKEVWDEFKCEEFTMCAMLFTTIKDNPAQIFIYGAPSYPWQETCIPSHGLSV
jgi:hypothetical protein